MDIVQGLEPPGTATYPVCWSLRSWPRRREHSANPSPSICEIARALHRSKSGCISACRVIIRPSISAIPAMMPAGSAIMRLGKQSYEPQQGRAICSYCRLGVVHVVVAIVASASSSSLFAAFVMHDSHRVSRLLAAPLARAAKIPDRIDKVNKNIIVASCHSCDGDMQ